MTAGASDQAIDRTIATLRGAAPGPTLIIVAGIHGNEQAGIAAAQRALAAVPAGAVRGEVVALIGNQRAVATGRRQIARDLNRMWTEPEITRARGGGGGDPEHAELAELGAAIDAAIARARGPVHLLDLHTTSAPGVAFAVVGPTAAHRRFAEAFQLPGVAGLEQALPGVMTAHYGRLGCITLAIEGGQHTTPVAADNLAAVITIALETSGVIAEVTGAAAARAHLLAMRGALPAMIDVVVRHAVRPEDGFCMVPGFENLAITPAGALLAHDASGEIRAPFDGVLLLPLYQPDGDDGFFYGRAADVTPQ